MNIAHGLARRESGELNNFYQSRERKRPMKCAEITDKVIEAIESGKYDHIRLNYLNGDWCKFCELR